MLYSFFRFICLFSLCRKTRETAGGGDEKMTSAASMTPTEKTVSPADYHHSDEGNGDEFEDKIVQEFSHLLEKSKQLFNGLRYIVERSVFWLISMFFRRDLPQYGHKQWQPYFGRTFDIYTKLWKFQQQHR